MDYNDYLFEETLVKLEKSLEESEKKNSKI